MSAQADISGWRDLAAPSLADIERLAREAFAGLPAVFRARCGDVVIAVEDFADEDALDALGIEDPFELTGLYQGVDLTSRSETSPPLAPDMVFLYRRPILDEWCERGEVGLAELVAHVLVHEIGHHFGLSDEDMDKLLESAE